MKLLLDEHLSPRLVGALSSVGCMVHHIAHLGRSGVTDAALFRYAYEHDCVVATINAGDFLILASGVDLHPGLIILRVSGLAFEGQRDHLAPALADSIARESRGESMVNVVLEITGVGEFRRRSIPPP